MNTQVHKTTGTSPCELVFGQKPRSVVFPTSTATGVILEEDLTEDGVHFDTGTSTLQLVEPNTAERSTSSSRNEDNDQGIQAVKPANEEHISEAVEGSDQTMEIMELAGHGRRHTIGVTEESDLEMETMKQDEGRGTPGVTERLGITFPQAVEDGNQDVETNPAREKSTLSTGDNTAEDSDLEEVMLKPAEGCNTPAAIKENDQVMEIIDPATRDRGTTRVYKVEESHLEVETAKPPEVQDSLAAEETDLGLLITEPAGRRHTSGTAEKSEAKMVMKNPEGQRTARKERNGTADDHRQQTLSTRERALSTTKKHKEVGIIYIHYAGICHL